jgi:predicted flavoprotein YhiN
MIYDVIIIWAWASWLFAWIHLDKKLNKLLLEKTDKIWTKLLLSGWERANVSNINIDIENDYFSQNKKFLRSIFSKYNQFDFLNFCSENWLNLVEEDRGRMILETWNSKEILDLFLKKIRSNNCEIKLGSEVYKILKNDEWYEIILKNKQKYLAKNIIISTWWKSFFHTWSTWDWYNFAKDFWLKITKTFPWLCWITTKKDLSELSWISLNLNLKLIDISTKKVIYSEKWPLLFTHFWLSWPIIFNSWIAIWEYLENILNWENIEEYIWNNLLFELEFELDNLPKKIIKLFNLNEENKIIKLHLHSLRSLKEAKITTGWIKLDELDNNMQSKKYNWLYFIWEIVDVTWKTWWYNLQWCWSSAYVSSNNINLNF